MIHPAAFVDPDAQIHPTATIAPYALVEGPVVIGAGTQVQSHAVITGHVTIGTDNVIGYGAVLGGLPQDLSFNPRTVSFVRVGDRNVIREHCTIHRGTKPDSATTVGSGNLLMVGAHLGHNVVVGDNVILANNVLLGGYVTVADRAFLGGGSVVHQFTRIGQIALLQGMTAVSKDIPPFGVAAGRNSVVGLNVVGLKRAGFDPASRHEAKRAFDLLYHGGLNIAQAREQAAQQAWRPEIRTFWEFVAASKRGICGFSAWSRVKGRSVTGEEEG
ncbi:MAG: acyl-ACP--UDP-N-acetylglucosamine O-acyltransferase [Verrucomicrobia bacterium]|nr:acyl-ACP--UDP-N-acetylglucosamine O-acyltransferase [Verrucomicrobiota bacterium]